MLLEAGSAVTFRARLKGAVLLQEIAAPMVAPQVDISADSLKVSSKEVRARLPAGRRRRAREQRCARQQCAQVPERRAARCRYWFRHLSP